jgi:hypothetical protein
MRSQEALQGSIPRLSPPSRTKMDYCENDIEVSIAGNERRSSHTGVLASPPLLSLTTLYDSQVTIISLWLTRMLPGSIMQIYVLWWSHRTDRRKQWADQWQWLNEWFHEIILRALPFEADSVVCMRDRLTVRMATTVHYRVFEKCNGSCKPCPKVLVETWPPCRWSLRIGPP